MNEVMSRTFSLSSSVGAVAILTGCMTGSQANLPPPLANSIAQSRVTSGATLRKDDLLYVADSAASAVYVYRWRTGALKQTLIGFNGVNGVCADRSGNVWIANAGASEMQEYAHGGTQPIASLSDPAEFPFSCSIDPARGDLAVTNLNASYHGGNVGIYTKASGAPRFYTDPKFYSYFSCAYDDKGNLFVDGADKRKHVEFAELARGGQTLTDIKLRKLPAKILIAGGLQWDGKYIALGSQLSPVAIYQIRVAGSTGTVVGTTPLDEVQIVIGFWKQGSKVVAPDALAGEINFYDYPSGGDPIKVIGHSGEPVAAVVSKGMK
ncbi:MAG: hypothetical protein WAL67_09975 [Candidatus Cybelea sp.]